MAEKLFEALKGLPEWLVVAILSAAPISEVRGGIPMGFLYYKMPMWQVFIIAFIAAVVSVLWVIPLYGWMSRTFDKTPVLGPIFHWFTEHAGRRKPLVERYGMSAVTFLVAVPCPGFGGWSASLVAAVTGMTNARFLVCLLIGTFIACALMTAFVLGGVEIFNSIQPTEAVAASVAP